MKLQLPSFAFPTIKIPQPNGDLLIRAGKPIVVGDEIGTVETARLLGLRPRSVQSLFDAGEFQTAFKPGGHRNSQWRVSRAEVLQRRSGPGIAA